MVERFGEALPVYSVTSAPVTSAPDAAAGALGGMEAAPPGAGISGFEAHSATSELSRLCSVGGDLRERGSSLETDTTPV